MSKTAIIIPYYKGDKYIHACLQSIIGESQKIKIFIVDNDHKNLKLDQAFSDVTILKLEAKVGFARAVNFGVYHALCNGYSKFIILNQDTWFIENSLSLLLSATEKQSNKLLSPIVYNYEGTEVNNVFQKYLNDHRSPTDKSQLDLFPAVCLAFDEAFLKKNLLFDPVFHHYGEDYDFIYRNKLKATLLPDSRVGHFSAINEQEKTQALDRDFNYLRGLYLINLRYKKEGSSLALGMAHLRYFLLKKRSLYYSLKYLNFMSACFFNKTKIQSNDSSSILARTIATLSKDGFQQSAKLKEMLNA